MITSYEVGAVYRIVDQATPTLLKIAGTLEKLDALGKKVGLHLKEIGGAKLGLLSKELGTLENKLSAISKEAGATREGLVSAFSRADASIAATTGAVAKLTTELAAARKEAAGLRLPRPGGSGGGGGAHPRPGQSGSGSGRGHSPSMAGHTGIQLGVMGFFGAEAVGHGLKEVLKDASELEHVRQQMVQAGFKERDIAKATTAAWDEARKYGLNVSKVLGDIKELTLPFGSVEHAIEFINPLEKMKIVLNAVSEGKGTSAADAVYKMARAGELKGLQDPHEFVSYFDNMTKAISASGGKITPNDFMLATKYSKLSGMGFDQEYFTRYLPTLIQTMGASTAGTASQSLFSTLVQGTVTKRALGRMDDLGLIGDPSKIIYDNKGDPKGFNPGAVKGTELLVKNPFKWAQEVLLPLLEKKYGSIDVQENKQKAIEDLGGLFGNRNSAAAIAELALRGKTFNKDAALIDQARGVAGADAMLKEDPNAVAAKLKGAWENLMTALGGPGVKVAVEGMNSLASGITSVTKWATDNPGATKLVLEAMVGLGAALAALTVAGAVAGAVLLAPGGAIAIGLTALVGVLGSLAAFNWDALKDIGTKMKDALMAPVEAIAAVWEKVKGLFGGLFNKTSFEGGGGMGGLIQNASFSTGAGANDNFGSSGVARALGRGGGSGGTGAPIGVPAGVSMTATERNQLGLILKYESGYRNVPNYINDQTHTAQGYYQLTNTNWRRIAPMLGITAPNAMSASLEDQTRVAHYLLRHGGIQNWSNFNPRLRGALSQGERAAVPAPETPTAGPPPRQKEETHVHNVFVDGERIERHVTRRMVAKAKFPTSIGGTDTYGVWHGPGTAGTKVA